MSFQPIITKMIGIIQNTTKQVLRLRAQRQLYATAKIIFGWQVFIGGPLAIATAVLALNLPSSKGYIAAWALLVTLCDLFWFTPWQKRLRNEAARIQEAFDCDVLELPWNELKAGKKPDPELIKEQSDLYEEWASSMHSVQNWYSPSVDALPMPVARIICQRSNCWWDSTQRRHYAAWLIGGTASVFILICLAALCGSSSFEAFLLKGVIPLAPILLLAIRQHSEQREAATRLDKLKDHCGSIWNTALSGAPETTLSNMSRNLQDEILENRKKAPPVLDFIFKRIRNKYESSMNHASEDYVAEAKAKLGLT